MSKSVSKSVSNSVSDPVVVGLCGSLRAGSLNRKLMLEAARLFGPAHFTAGDLRLPLYDGDLEDAGMPDSVAQLGAQLKAADAVIVVTPEYNQSLSGVMKNALDWISRVDGRPWAGKPVALMSAAGGRAGGARANYALRLAMAPFRARLLQSEVLVAGAAAEFDEDGRLTSPVYTKSLTAQMQELRAEIEVAQWLVAKA